MKKKAKHGQKMLHPTRGPDFNAPSGVQRKPAHFDISTTIGRTKKNWGGKSPDCLLQGKNIFVVSRALEQLARA